MAQLVEQQGVAYDLSKVGHLGIVSASPWLWVGQPNNPAMTSPSDAMKPGVVLNWGASGLIDGTADGGAITCTVLKLNCKVVLGYKGTADIALAIERREMDAMYVSDTSANLYVRSGQNRAIATMARNKSQFFPETPTIFELVKLTPEQEWWFDFRSTLDAFGRVLVTHARRAGGPACVPSGRDWQAGKEPEASGRGRKVAALHHLSRSQRGTTGDRARHQRADRGAARRDQADRAA